MVEKQSQNIVNSWTLFFLILRVSTRQGSRIAKESSLVKIAKLIRNELAIKDLNLGLTVKSIK